MVKLKLIKSYLRLYLRSTMSHQRLYWLTIVSVEKGMLTKIDYNSLVNDFASQKINIIIFNLILYYNKKKKAPIQNLF
jgi:hypothetical protein